ncbi:MAG: hypothetical protein JNK48_16015, partial [Bryobacterales bacterium]|nr:hypothetical protein [Bryobacterales bacterium]
MTHLFLMFGLVGLNAQELRGPGSAHLQDSAVWTLQQDAARLAAEGRIHQLNNSARPEFVRGPEGERTLLLRIHSAGAAALRAHFEDMHLAEGDRLFVYGLDANGRVTRSAGPYEAAGPMESGEFWTPALPGADLIVELQSTGEPATLPFLLEEVAVLDGIDENAWTVDRRQVFETRRSWFRGMPVEHHVIDGVGVWEGDILLGRIEELQPYEAGKSSERQSFAISSTSYRWTGGVVPYTVDATIPTPTRITDAIAHWNTKLAGTIQLVPRTTETAYVSFVRASSSGTCSSYVGRLGIAAQPINIGDSCSTGNTIHEIGHAIGLYHEHTRTDRDTYVKVNLQNVTSTATSNFNIVSGGLNLGAYEYG